MSDADSPAPTAKKRRSELQLLAPFPFEPNASSTLGPKYSGAHRQLPANAATVQFPPVETRSLASRLGFDPASAAGALMLGQAVAGWSQFVEPMRRTGKRRRHAQCKGCIYVLRCGPSAPNAAPCSSPMSAGSSNLGS